VSVQSISYTTGVAALAVDIDAVPKDSADDPDSRLFRGTVPFGAGVGGAMGFVADLKRNLVFLDRNRNGNVKDDGPGVAANADGGRFTTFSGLRVDARSGRAVIPYEFSLQCYGSRWSGFWRLTVDSGWFGVVEIAGRKWTMGLVDNLDGVVGPEDIFILRSAEEAPPGVTNVPSEPSDAACARSVDYSERTAGSSNLSVNGVGFDLGFTWRGDAAGSVLDVSFAPSATECGTIEIEGGQAKRVVLGGPAVVVLEPPPKSAAVPAGFYDKVTVFLGEGGKPAQYFASLKPVRVIAGGTRRIKAGGRLENVATVVEQGSFLRIGYDLRGTDGNSYQPMASCRDEKPSFSIRKNGKEIEAGSFEYG
jgi:hypothetical protein